MQTKMQKYYFFESFECYSGTENEYICTFMPRYSFNRKTLAFEERRAFRYARHVRITLLVLLAPFLAAFYLWTYTSVLDLDLPKTASLKRRKASWEARYNVLDRQLDICGQTLAGIEMRDDEVYRSIFGLSPIPRELALSGFDRSDVYRELVDNGAGQRLKSTAARIDMLSKRVYLRGRSLKEVLGASEIAGNMMSCVPNIPPLMTSPGNFRLSSSFGMREDPVYGGAARHSGQDFAAKQGTPVYATGDGVVESTSFQYRGYGNQIVIDHGYGYKTRYAHLSTIDVREGMKVSRGDKIGTVGSTGKSTGSHLHYEVIYMGRAMNPRNYMDLDMSVAEYKAMLERRANSGDDAAVNVSTMELLRRRRLVE